MSQLRKRSLLQAEISTAHRRRGNRIQKLSSSQAIADGRSDCRRYIAHSCQSVAVIDFLPEGIDFLFRRHARARTTSSRSLKFSTKTPSKISRFSGRNQLDRRSSSLANGRNNTSGQGLLFRCPPRGCTPHRPTARTTVVSCDSLLPSDSPGTVAESHLSCAR